MESKYKLTIAFVCEDAYGNMYACIGLGQTLLKRGHRVVFIARKTWKIQLLSYGFEVETYCDSTDDAIHDASQQWTELAHNYGHSFRMSSFNQLKHLLTHYKATTINYVINTHDLVTETLIRIKPHVIIGDTEVTVPAIMTSGVPWINLLSCNQLVFAYPGIEELPPGGSGYATYGDKNEWKKFRDEKTKCFSSDLIRFNQWIQSKGVEPLKDPMNGFTESPFLNLYLCPEELDYDDVRPKPFKWHNIDCLMRDECNDSEFVIPESLREKRGKLIYLSMGSILSADISLMKHLVSILSHSPNRFIVSKGPLGDHYELPTNMWGDCMLPQTKILPLVDLVINHGGNNTVTETMLFGKPMIVMPLCYDAYDTAQRIHEKKLGIRFDPFNNEPKELLNAIETLICDDQLKEKLTIISERIKKSNSKNRAAKLIEDLALK